ncbi:hypothetical protein RI129_007815 [Pyrocoelia pectoralis]|uniref:Insulin-like domain-containing protein n=1 Tax=Pyrocoelia pectoralis TaxID=417401 RepID=A0AAN7ZF80_9COLE
MVLWDLLYALAVYLLATFTVSALTSTEDKLRMMQSKNATYCGSALSDALSLVCRGKYNTPVAHGKFITNNDLLLKVISDRDRRSATLPLPSHIQQLAATYNQRKKRYIISQTTKGVYDECCKNPCSYAVLRTYCWD